MSSFAQLEPGEHRLTCPACGRNERDRTFGVTVQHTGAAVGHCFRCGYVETYRPERKPTKRPGMLSARPVAPVRREILSEYGTALFGAGVAISGTVGERYLLARGCVIPPADGDLRFHPELRHPSGYVGPALVALVTHAETRVPMTLHRTWVRSDGTKAECNPPRMLLGGHAKKNGVIRLWPDECVTHGLGVTEGIESGLSLAHAITPIWTCIDAGNLAVLPVLNGIETLMVGADHDPAGLRAAHACAIRWHGAGLEVRVVVATGRKADLNDVVLEAA